MAGATFYLSDAILTHVFRNQGSPQVALDSPTTLQLALFSTDPTDAGGGTELSGNGYARATITFDPVGSPQGFIKNSSELTFTASGGNWSAATSCGIYDDLSPENLIVWAPIASVTLNDGFTLRFTVGNATVTHG